MDAQTTKSDARNTMSKYGNNGSTTTVDSIHDINVDDLYYDMSGKKLLIIFNHFEFKETRYFGTHTPSPRTGTAEDVKRLRLVFEALDFEVQTNQDLEYDDILDIISRVSQQDHSQTSCVAVAILTHGSNHGVLFAADKPYELSDLITLFENCHKTLIGKPKLFFIQACRGPKTDEGRIVCDGKLDIPIIPTHADFLVLYSTVEDFVSWRDDDGSWLIQEFCEVISRQKDQLDLLQIITMTNRRIAVHRVSYSTVPGCSDKKQMPETRFTLTKSLKFK